MESEQKVQQKLVIDPVQLEILQMLPITEQQKENIIKLLLSQTA